MAPPNKVPVPRGIDDLNLEQDAFSPVGDETRTVGGQAVQGFVREGDDIPLRKKQTLARYLGRITAGNSFPISADLYVETSATGPDGAPVALKDGLTNPQTGFTNPNLGTNPFTGQPDPKNDLSTYSDSGGGVSDADALKWTQDNLSKGKEGQPKTYDGHTLLRYVNGQEPRHDGSYADPADPDQLTTGFVSKVLLHNRFTPQSPASSQADGSRRMPLRYQAKFGQFDPNAPEISQDALSKIGSLLALRAAGELGAESTGFDPPDTMNVKTILPGKSQLGISTIDTLVLEARSALNDISGGTPQTGRLQSDFDATSSSVGQINSYADPFSGLLPLGMSALAIALVLAAEIVIDLFTGVMNLISSASSTASTSRDTLGRYILGKSYTNPGQEQSGLSLPLPARLFGIERTQHTYADAVAKGLEVFFDIDAGRLVVEPGFFVVLLRSILRSAATLVQKVRDIFGSGNPFNILNAIVGFLDAIRTSKIIAAMNVFAHIGDNALVLDESNPSDPDRPSTVDDVPSGLPGSAGVKSRDDGSLRLAWRSSTAPFLTLLPATLKNAGAPKQLANKLAGLNRSYGGMNTLVKDDDAASNRIPLDTLRKIEARLEAEYLPFYFHDMRTNEVVAFHAFLSTLNENFAVNHDTSDSYGRVDSIEIYKNTKRTLTISFVVVATDNDDFDHMWAKINKLITLAYPQWSEGLAKKTADGNSFIQPFSQVLAASPVFRLRIGDLIKSNYSRFALKRIFGYGSSNFSYTDKNSPGGGTGDSNVTNSTSLSSQAAASKPGQGNSSQAVQLSNIKGGHTYLLRPAPSSGYLKKGSKSTTENLRNNDLRRVKVSVVNSDAENIEVTDAAGNTYVVFVPDLIELRDEGSPDGKAATNADPTDKTFFSPGSNLGVGPDLGANTIVRSFETAMSKGLACVFKSLNFNWLEGTWETEVFGSKAPKMVKVDIALAPFHDIAPGLDAYGANRAPVYNVGQFANLMGDDDTEGEKQFESFKTTLWAGKNRNG